MMAFHRQSFRLVTVAVGVCSILAACADEPSSPLIHDVEVEKTIVSMRVQADVRDVSSASERSLLSTSMRSEAIVIPERSLRALRQGAPEKAVRISHYRDSRGTVHSIGAVMDPDGKPPRFVYAFENGKIRSIVSTEYARHGRGWLKKRSRITTFDSTGTPLFQTDLRSDPAEIAAGARVGAAVRDALATFARAFQVRELHAAEAAGEACFSEWLTYAAAGFALASASSALTAAIASCVTSGGGCASIEKLTGIWLGALAAWNLALDKLEACRLKAWINETNNPPPSGASPDQDDEWPSGTSPDDFAKETKTVQQFIDDAIAAGNYECSDNGDRCIYYAT